MDDRQIIELYHRRDEVAIKQTDQKYGRYCFSIALSILHSHHDAEECVSDTFLQAWNSIPPASPQSLKLYLAKIIRNVSFNRYKRQNSQKRGGGEIDLVLDEISELISNTKDICDEMEERELCKSIQRFLCSISLRNRNIFIWRYFYCYSIKKIAEALELRENNVSKILLRTRKKLQQYLEKEGYSI